jgi:hypothetical protein
LTAAVVSASFVSRADAVSLNVSADPAVPFTCQWDTQHPAAYLYTLRVGSGSALIPDLTTCTAGTTQPISVVGVVDALNWGTSQSDPMTVSAYVSTVNWQQLNLYLHSATSKSVSFGVAAYAYDPIQRQYFQRFSTGPTTVIPATAVATNLAQPLVVAASRATFVSSPVLYQVQFQAAAPVTSAQLAVRNSATTTVIKTWGGLPVLGGTVTPCVQPRLKKGLTQRAARRRLLKHNCRIRVRHVHARRARRGRVVRVGGRPGKVYPAGHKVTVYIGA